MGWGGARDGAGRKKQEIKKKMRGFRLTDDEWAFMKDALAKYRKGEAMEPKTAPAPSVSEPLQQGPLPLYIKDIAELDCWHT